MKAKIAIVITALTISAIPANANDNCDDGFCNAVLNATTGVVTKTRLSDAEIKAILDKRATDVPNLPVNTAVQTYVTPNGYPYIETEGMPSYAMPQTAEQNTETVTPSVVSETATTVTETTTAITETTTATATKTSTTFEALYAQIMALLTQVLALIAKLNG
jgi:hypothetical protein